MQIVSVCATVLILVILFAGGLAIGSEAYDFGFRIFAEPAMADADKGKDVSVQITDTMSAMDIAKLMEEKGLCRSSTLFYVQIELSDYKNMIRPGLYTLSTSMNAEQILSVIGAKDTNEEGKQN